MDLLRGVAIILVILSHATDMATGPAGFDNPTLMALRAFFAPYRMPVLLVLSGVLLHRSLEKGTSAYIIGKFRNLAWPWLLWTPLILFLAGFPLIANSASGTIQMWLGGVTTWFLTALGFSYALALVTRRIPSLAVAAMLVLASLATAHLTLVGKLFWFAAFFFVGDWAGKHVGRWLGMPKLWILLAGSAAVAFGFVAVAQQVYEVRYRLDYFVMSLIGVAVAGWCASRIPSGRFSQWFVWVGRNSIVPYLTHRPVIYVLEDVTRATPLAGNPAVPAIGGLMTVLICALLIKARPSTWWLYEMPGSRARVKMTSNERVEGKQAA